ncbi:MAG: hypothetical protein DSO07_09135 [Thermoproteota archaeon]|uniref:Uncharacterized protein n=1 Tax=Candidatus Methanodesulfokora washburnensis TaxID=2478471 RepID=A0A520KHR1_9CREN|nr:MAG: hypothetical protein EF810_07195 [Candidatus Methanodesulfokores washburnensis]TDA40449.1 MAG: hypothetical protein DSO07_09135 [Candidatus Korarchaeota archaeon]
MPILKDIHDVIKIARKVGISIKTENEEYAWEMSVLEEKGENALIEVGYMDKKAEFLVSKDGPVSGKINNREIPKDELGSIFNLLMFPLDFFLRSQDEKIVKGAVDESIGTIEPIGERDILGMRSKGFRVKISDLARKYLTDMKEAEYWLAKIGDYDVLVAVKGVFSENNVVEVFLNNIEMRINITSSGKNRCL